jgi:hypothetical protein
LLFIKAKEPQIRELIVEARKKELDRQEPDTLLPVMEILTSIDLRDLPRVAHAKLAFIHGLRDNAAALSPAQELAKLNHALFITVADTGLFLIYERVVVCCEVFKAQP